jgi:hypothetical protein
VFSARTQDSLKNWTGRKHDKLDTDLAEAAVRHVCLTQPTGAILVFLTGWCRARVGLNEIGVARRCGRIARLLLA